MAEYISKHEVIEEIKRIYCTNCNSYNGAMCRACEHMDDMDIIEDMPVADVQPVNQWISVDDNLPEWDKTVLVWYASDTLFGVSEGYGLSWYHGSWRVNDLNGENIRIFYWQYLPEPPKDGDTE